MDTAHQAFAEEIIALTGIRNIALRRALAQVRREDFLPPGPWLIETIEGGFYLSETADPRHVLHAVGVALDPARALNNANPIRFAGQMERIGLCPGATVFHVGAGSGYYSALLAELVGSAGKVIAAEIDPALRTAAERNLAPWRQIAVIGDALAAELPPLDLIYSSAGLGTLPSDWLAAVKPGGKMALPVTGALDHGGMFLFEKMAEGSNFSAELLSFTRHYPCLGTREATGLAEIEAALARPISEIRSLRRDPHEKGADCWLHRESACLSRLPA